MILSFVPKIYSKFSQIWRFPLLHNAVGFHDSFDPNTLTKEIVHYLYNACLSRWELDVYIDNIFI